MSDGGVIGFASIEIIPRVDRFSSEVKSEIASAMEVAESHVERSTEQMEDSFRELANSVARQGERIERSMAEAGRKGSIGFGSWAKGAFVGLAAGGVAMMGQLASSAITAGIEMTGTFDKAKSSFSALLGSVEEGDKLLNEVKQFAFKTPFDVKDLADTTRNLMAQGAAFGVTRGNVLDYTAVLGDMIAITGGGETEMMRTVRALGQMGSSSKLMAQDMNQIQQSIPGLNVWKAMGDGLGVTEAAAREMGKNGLIPGAQAANILVDAMRKFPGAAGEMERQASTVTGVLQNFKEQALSSLVDSMRPLTDIMRTTLADPAVLEAVRQLGNGFGQLLAGLSPLIPSIVQLGAIFGNVMGVLGQALQPVAAVLGPMLVEFFTRLEGPLGVAAETFGMVLQALVPLLEPIGALIAVGAELIAGFLTAAQPALQALADAFVVVADAVTPIIESLGDEMAPVMTELGKAFAELVIALVPLIPPLVELSMIGTRLLIAIMPLLPPIFRWLADVIQNYVAPAVAWLADAMTQVGPTITAVKDKVIEIKDKFVEWWNKLTEVKDGVVENVNTMKDKITEFKDSVVEKLGEIVNWFSELPGKIVNALTELPGQLAYAFGFALGAAWTAMTVWLPGVIDWFFSLPGKILNAVVTLAPMLWNWAWGALTGAYNAIIGVATSIINFVTGLPGRIISGVASFATMLWNWATGAFSRAYEAVQSGATSIIDFVTGLPGKIITGIGDLGSLLYDKGKDMIEGLWDGIKNAKDWLIDKVKGLAGDVVDGFKDALDIFSPSKVMAREVGKPIAQGIAVGFNDAMDELDPQFSARVTGNAGGGGGLNFNGPVSFGSDMGSAVDELGWFQRTRMGAA